VTSLGLETVGRALLWEAETRRLRAQFLASAGAAHGDVEAELDRAIAVARRQGARMLEVRADTTLLGHELRRGRAGRVVEVREHVGSLLSELAEAPDTLEVREAASLLARA